MKKIIYIIIAIVVAISFSCEDYLKETDYHGQNISTSFESEETFEYLVNACYVTMRVWYGKENGWDFTEVGTDLYTWGLDIRSASFCDYEAFITGEVPARISGVWRELYKGLNTCNLVLDRIDDVPYNNPDVKKQRRGEVHFLRAHYLWLIVESWGGVHFQTTPQEVESHEANRTDVSVFYDQIFDDLTTALELVPETSGTEWGRIQKDAVRAMFARCYLYRKDYANAELYADMLIDDYALETDWKNLWSMDNLHNSEVIWSVNYSDDVTTTTANFRNEDEVLYNQTFIIQRFGGSQGHLMWAIRYENTAWGLARALPYHRGFQRWMPTEFFIDLFDETVDQRFYGSFFNLWTANSAPAISPWPTKDTIWNADSTAYHFKYPKDGRVLNYDDRTDTIEIDPSLYGQPMFSVGDTAMLLVKGSYPGPRILNQSAPGGFPLHPNGGYIIFDQDDMYLPDGRPNVTINRQWYFPILGKYHDTARVEVSDENSNRHIPVFRVAEMYLISAEAALLQSNPGKAFDRFTALANARAIGENGAALLSSYGITSGSIDIDVILDERARELATEHQRFFDLKRMGEEVFLRRIRTANTDAAPNVEAYHMVRPIPQTQLDAARNKTEFYQNPGY